MSRDHAREARLPTRWRRLIEQYAVARSAAEAYGKVQWGNVYAAIEGGDPDVESELRELIAGYRTKARQVRRWKAEEEQRAVYESQALEIEPHWSYAYIERRVRPETPVWMYHGTSSRLLPRIRREGLRPDAPRTWGDATPGFVYLTLDPGYALRPAGDARFYARRAAGRWGGEPVVLRVIVPWGTLETDEDDADLSSGRIQYRTSYVIPTSQIMEVGGRPFSAR